MARRLQRAPPVSNTASSVLVVIDLVMAAARGGARTRVGVGRRAGDVARVARVGRRRVAEVGRAGRRRRRRRAAVAPGGEGTHDARVCRGGRRVVKGGRGRPATHVLRHVVLVVRRSNHDIVCFPPRVALARWRCRRCLVIMTSAPDNG